MRGTDAAGNLLTQVAARARKAGSDRANRHAHFLSDILIGCAFHTASLDDLFLVVAQSLKSPLSIA